MDSPLCPLPKEGEADTGRPEEADTGRPEEADTGRPEEADTGRPEEADTGRPEETPACAGDDKDIPSSSQTKRHNLDMDTHTHLPSRGTSAASDPIYRFIMIGKTGTGKSTVGNIILGGSHFPVGHGMVPITTQASVRSCENIQVLDTPDISDLSAEDRKTETERWRRLMSSEPSAVLLTVRCDLNFTVEELGYTCYLNTKLMLQDCFPFHRLVVVFTFGDRCAGDLDTTLQTECPALEHVLHDAGGRYVLFNDRTKEDEKVQQRQKLLEIVDKMGKEARETVNSPPETTVSSSKMEVSQPETEVSPPETGASPSKAEVSPTEMEVGSSETEVSQLKMENSPPETAVSPPDTGVCPPKTGISPPDSGISPPEVEVSQAEKEISSAGQHVERRVLLIGKTGTGKSTVGNILLGRVHFPVGCIMTSTTTDVTEGCSQIHNITLKVVDTPDISEMDMKEQEKVLEVSRWKARVEPGHYAVVLTVRCDRRYTAEEYAIYQQIKKLWKDNSFCDHLVVALTFGDRLDGDLDTQLKIVCPELQHVLRDAGKRYVLFNDMATEKEKGEQIDKLMHEVNKIAQELANSGGEKKSIRERLASWDAIPGPLRRVLKK